MDVVLYISSKMALGLNSVSNRPISAVQQERKPPEPKDKIGNVATSTQKIYIRKDLSSPSAAIPTFSIKVRKISCL